MHSTVSALESQIKHQKAQWVSGDETLSLTQLLSCESFQSVIHESRAYRARVFTPMVTLFLFIKQVLNPDKSCRQAVSHFVAEQLMQGVDKIASTNTGPYTKARQRFPKEVVERLVQMSGESASQKAQAGWKVYGIVQWKKPARPPWMSQETYEQYPDELTVREFKVDGHVYVTTFLAKSYHKRELTRIYKLRWHIEINLNSIKSTMNMDMLSCKSPEMVRKEIGIHFLAYNLIRILIAQACCQQQALSPREISFKGTVQLLNAFMPYFVKGSKKHKAKLYARMLSLIVKNKIGNRPGRVEPRAIKQRHKPFKTLDKPRHIEKVRLKKKVEKMIAKYAEA